jgi:hypothetical protein
MNSNKRNVTRVRDKTVRKEERNDFVIGEHTHTHFPFNDLVSGRGKATVYLLCDYSTRITPVAAGHALVVDKLTRSIRSRLDLPVWSGGVTGGTPPRHAAPGFAA